MTLKELLDTLDYTLCIKVYNRLSQNEHLGKSDEIERQLKEWLDSEVVYHALEESDYYDYYIEIK